VPASPSARYILSFPEVGDRVASQKDVEIWPRFLKLAATSSKRKDVDAALISLTSDIPGFRMLWTQTQPMALANAAVAVFGASEQPRSGVVAKVAQERLICYTAKTPGGFSGGPVIRKPTPQSNGQAVAVHSGRGSHIVNGLEGFFAECVAIDHVVAAAIKAQAWPVD
jgi:hypothetical protein